MLAYTNLPTFLFTYPSRHVDHKVCVERFYIFVLNDVSQVRIVMILVKIHGGKEKDHAKFKFSYSLGLFQYTTRAHAIQDFSLLILSFKLYFFLK